MTFLRKNHSGFTLVELMVAMVIGLLISGVAIAVFVTTKKTSQVGDALGRYQESFRYASSVMSRDIRDAGYVGCNASGAKNNLVTSTPFVPADDAGIDTAVRGYSGSATISTLTDRIAGTEVIKIQSSAGEPHNLTENMATASAAVKVKAADGDFAANDSVVISNCINSVSFKVTGATNATSVTTLAHASTGNSSASLSKAFQKDAQVARLETNYFYLAKVGNRSVLMRRIFRGSSIQNEEIADGIVNMQFLYGIGADIQSSTPANQYVKVSSTTPWDRVKAVRVCLVTESADDHLATQPQSYTNCDGGTVTATDHKLHATIIFTISLRNRVN